MKMSKARERLRTLLVLYTENVTGDACVGDEIVFLYPDTQPLDYRVVEGTILRDEYKGKTARHVFLIGQKSGETFEVMASDVYRYGTYARRRARDTRRLFLREKHTRGQTRKGGVAFVTRNV